MLALEYTPSVPRYVAAVAGRLTRAPMPPGAGALRLVEQRPPPAPGPGWMTVLPRLTGICGSDQAMLEGKASPYLASLTSSPFVPGHEVVGQIAAGPHRGRRVVLEPALGCVARGLDPPCPECAAGAHALCRAVVDGVVSAGLQTGYCRETGGGWSECFVAHDSQLHELPDDLADEDAVLVEPLACAMHAVAEAALPPSGIAVVIGTGALGLLSVAALRTRHPDATIVAIAKHRGQELQARRLGADYVCAPADAHLEVARITGARRLVGHLGRRMLLGGADRVLDCVGGGPSLETAVTITRPRGRVVLVGMPATVRCDLTPAWQREIELRGAYGYRDEFPAAIELARTLRPGRLLADGHPLRAFRRALEQAPRATRAGQIRTVFDLSEGT